MSYLRIFTLVLLISINPSSKLNADVIVIVKNLLDDKIFIKRKRATENEALEAAMKGCTILFKYNESMSLSDRKKMSEACFVHKVLNFDNL